MKISFSKEETKNIITEVLAYSQYFPSNIKIEFNRITFTYANGKNYYIHYYNEFTVGVAEDRWENFNDLKEAINHLCALIVNHFRSLEE